jgi:hypothetical protein
MYKVGGGEVFSKSVRFEILNGSKVEFWHDL